MFPLSLPAGRDGIDPPAQIARLPSIYLILLRLGLPRQGSSAPSSRGAAGKRMTRLVLEQLRKTFGGLAAVDGFDLTLEQGQLHALVGPNGCGKSTLFNLITGALRPDSGRVLWAERDITGMPPAAIARLGIGRKFQVPSVFEQLSVAENLGLAGLGRSAAALLAPGAPRRGHGAARDDPAHRQARPAGRRPLPWPAPMAGDRHAAGEPGAPAAARRADGRHDRVRDGRDRGAHPPHRRRRRDDGAGHRA